MSKERDSKKEKKEVGESTKRKLKTQVKLTEKRQAAQHRGSHDHLAIALPFLESFFHSPVYSLPIAE